MGDYVKIPKHWNIQTLPEYQSSTQLATKVIIDNSHAFYAIQLYAKRNEYMHCMIGHSGLSDDLTTRLAYKLA